MENNNETIVKKLNENIEILVKQKESLGVGESSSEQILYRLAQNNVPQLLSEMLSSLGVHKTEGLIKVSNMNIRIDTITDILRHEDIVFETKDDKVLFKYSGKVTGDFVIVCELQIINTWLSFRSYVSGKVVKKDKTAEVLKLLNEYNYTTRHSKACLLKDNTIVLLRNDNANIIWDKKDFRSLILIDILVMIDFYKTNQVILSDIFE